MTASDFSSISAVLAQYQHFEDCLLNSLSLENFGTALELRFDYIWGAGEYTVAAAPRIIAIRLHGFQEAHFSWPIPAHLVEDPDRADWGLSEVAIVRVLPKSDLLDKHHDSPFNLHHLVVEWEDDRRIDVLFVRLEVIEHAREQPEGADQS